MCRICEGGSLCRMPGGVRPGVAFSGLAATVRLARRSAAQAMLHALTARRPDEGRCLGPSQRQPLDPGPGPGRTQRDPRNESIVRKELAHPTGFEHYDMMYHNIVFIVFFFIVNSSDVTFCTNFCTNISSQISGNYHDIQRSRRVVLRQFSSHLDLNNPLIALPSA